MPAVNGFRYKCRHQFSSGAFRRELKIEGAALVNPLGIKIPELSDDSIFDVLNFLHHPS